MRKHMPTCPVTRRPDDPKAFCECGAGLANALTEMKTQQYGRPVSSGPTVQGVSSENMSTVDDDEDPHSPYWPVRKERRQQAWHHLDDTSTPEQLGTAIFHAEYGPDGVKTAITVTRADRWILVNREFMAGLRDEGELKWPPLTIVVGRPDSVMYLFDRKFDEHSDVYERIDEPAAPAPDDGVVDLDPEVAELLASNERPDGLKRLRQASVLVERAEAAEADAARSAARVDALTEVLNEVLGSFTHQGYPGEPCLRTGWIGTRVVARWRRIAAGKPSFDEMVEQLAGVELTDEQRELLRKIWASRAAELPVDVTSVGEAGARVLRAAMAQMLEISRRYDA